MTRCQMPRPPRYTTERSNPALRACRTGLGSAAARSFHAPSRRRKENGGTNAFLSSEVSNAWAIVSSFQFPLLQPCLLFGNDSDFFRKPKLDSRSLALAALSDERVVHFSYPLSMSSCARGRRPDALPSEPQSRRSSGVRRMAAPALPLPHSSCLDFEVISFASPDPPRRLVEDFVPQLILTFRRSLGRIYEQSSAAQHNSGSIQSSAL